MLHIFHSLLFHFLLSTPDFYCVLILLHNLHSFRFQFLSTPDFSSQKTAQGWGFYWKYKMITRCFLHKLAPDCSRAWDQCRRLCTYLGSLCKVSEFSPKN